MALVVYWYGCVCFGIVAAAFVGSLRVLWIKEVAPSRWEDHGLLGARSDADHGFVRATTSAHVGHNQLWSSCWEGLHPGWLMATRFASFAIMAGFLSWDILEWDASIFVYYTEWTFALVMVYFALGTLFSAYGCWLCLNTTLHENGERDAFLKKDVEENRTEDSETYRERYVIDYMKLPSRYAREEFQQRAGFWGYLMQTTYQTCAGAVILTDIVFWCVLVPFLSNTHLGLNMLMCFMHTLNVVFLILDTLLNSLPFPWFRFAYFVQWSCLYVVFQWVLHACGFTWWPYPFLELNTPWAPLWYFGLAVVHIPCYGMYALIVEAKNWILPKIFPHAFAVWRASELSYNPSSIGLGSFAQWWSATSSMDKQNFGGLDQNLLAWTIWNLWKARNLAIFGKAKLDPVLTWNRTLNEMQEYDQATATTRSTNQVRFMNENWEPPDVNVIKINYDASFNASDKITRISAVARNHDRIVVDGTNTRTLALNAFVAECFALKLGSKLIVQHGGNNVVLDTKLDELHSH